MLRKVSIFYRTNHLVAPRVPKKNFNHSSVVHEHLKIVREPFLEFVSKNKKIPQFIQNISKDDKNALALFNAIESGNSKAAIFDHPNCQLYLIYLHQEKMISLAVAMTVYVYLLALMQFTHRQPLKKNDQDIKSFRSVQVFPFIENNKFTFEGEEYLAQIASRYDEYNFPLNNKLIKEKILSLHPVEQWLISIKNDKENIDTNFKDRRYYAADELAYVLHLNLPFLTTYPYQMDYRAKDTSLVVPSVSLVHFLTSEFSKSPMEMFPILGRIGFDTLEKLHEQSQHPLAFYSSAIQSNLEHVHLYRGGPFFNCLHDIGHAYWASFISEEDRKDLFNIIIPAYKLALNEAIENKDKEAVEFLKNAIHKLYDFDLTPLGYYKDKETCFINYLKRICQLTGITPYLPFSVNLSENVIDRVIILLHFTFKKFSLSELQKKTFSYAIPQVKSEWLGRRGVALLALCDKDLGHFKNEKSSVEIDWQAWLDLLESTNDSKKIWRVAKEKYHEQLLSLIIDYQIKFFHPYLSLTPEKHHQLKLLAQEQLKSRFSYVRR